MKRETGVWIAAIVLAFVLGAIVGAACTSIIGSCSFYSDFQVDAP